MGQSSSRFLVKTPSSIGTPYAPSPSSLVSENESKKWRTYDYVIIGGGTAGCVLASRLSEDPNTTVLLLEAGQSPEQNLLTRIPSAWSKLLKTSVDWAYYTTPQTAFKGRSLYWARGKMLGGTSSLNAMIYHRCDPADFDSWESQGATGWGYESMKRYFVKAENYVPPAGHVVDASNYGTNGPWTHTRPSTAPICSEILEAAGKLGVPLPEDFNTPEGTIGAGAFVGAVDEKHERSSAATAYLGPKVLQRSNLTVAIAVTTEKILFSNATSTEQPRAVGVQFSGKRDGPRFAVAAAKEVILCAGVVGSPQILQLSGVGPASHLEQLDIPVVRDLPAVGANLLDHIAAGPISLRARRGWTWDRLTQSPLYAISTLLRWLLVRSGPMASLAFQLGMFIRSDDERLPLGGPLPTKDRTSGPRSPDIEYMIVPLVAADFDGTGAPQGTYGITAGALLLKPSSRGTVRLRTSDPYDHPLIDPNYLADVSDLNILIKSVRFLLQLARTPPLADVLDPRPGTKKDNLYWLTDTDPEKITDDDIKEYITNYGESTFHPTSSVRMGNDPNTSAVDPELRVHGVQALRVVDASAFPDEVSGHPCAVVIAMAEKAADLIKHADTKS